LRALVLSISYHVAEILIRHDPEAVIPFRSLAMTVGRVNRVNVLAVRSGDGLRRQSQETG
jgi:hypothetical protein